MMSNKFKGTGVALATPFREDKSIDFKALEKLVEYVINNGVDYLVVMGTTGESVTLNKDEKEAVTSFIIDVNKDRLPIVLGIGGNDTSQVVSSIQSTDLSKISAILSVAPYYNKPSQAGLYEHYKAITVASPLPVILYNVPGRTSSNISAETTLRLAHDFENVVAVKEASGNMSQIMQIIKGKPEGFSVISGDDALTLSMIALGGDGVISVVANAFPKEFSTMVREALNQNLTEARKYHYALLDIIGTLFEEGSPAGVKAALYILDIIPNILRLPLMPVSTDLFDKLKKQITDLANH